MPKKIKDHSAADKALAESRALRVADEDEARTVKAALPDAPIGELPHIIPDNWQLRDESIGNGQPCVLKRTTTLDGQTSWRPAISRPVIIKSWIDNQTTRLKGYRVAWKAHGKWRSKVIARELAADSSAIIKALAGHGFPVNSSNKADVVRYLADYESRNVDILPVEAASEQMGWQEEGGFLAGRQQIGTNVQFVGADDGEEQLANAVCSRGTSDGWRASVQVVATYPLVELALYASLAPPLLKILGVNNFAVDWAYKTSSGKTTTLRVAASVWGCPDEREPLSFIASWDATQVWLERAAAARSHLPLLVDDTKRAAIMQGKSLVPRIIYEIANGQGRGRGSIKGARATRYWRTILLSTGESRAVDTSKDGGTASRVISVWGNCFGGESIEIASAIDRLDASLKANYGHAGPEFVRWLIANEAEWPQWVEQTARLTDEIRVRARELCGIGVASRVSGYLALIEMTSRLAHRSLALPWHKDWTVDAILPTLVEGALEADRALEARRHALEWAHSNKGRFVTWDGENERKPASGWLGRWDRHWIGFFRTLLVNELESAGFDSRSVIRQWAERGWIRKSKDGKFTTTCRVDGDVTRLLALRLSSADPATPEQMSCDFGDDTQTEDVQ